MNKEEKNPSKCTICGRPTHKASKYCIFHASAEEKTEEEFKKGLEEYIEIIKKEDLDYSFYKFVFIGYVDFKKDFNITIFKNANFFEAIFEGNANFSGIKFVGNTYFIGTFFKKTTFFTEVTFEGNSVFIKTTFHSDVNFTTTTFNGEADFKSTKFESFTRFDFLTFNGLADFREATFKTSTEFKNTSFMSIGNFEDVKFNGHTSKFMNTTFKNDANFFVVKFKGNADFSETIFDHEANFGEATFENDINFRCKYFLGNLNLSKIKTSPGKKIFIRLINKEGIISFNHANLENTYLEMELGREILIDFTDALLKDTKIKKEQIEHHIIQEKEERFFKAQEIYLLLKNNFHSIGQYDDESWAFGKEKEMERKSNCHFKTLHKWLGSCFLNAIYGYGEKPERVFLSAILIILIFACVFMNCGIASPPSGNLPKYNILKELSTGILYGDLLNKYVAIPKEQAIKSLYFSTVTFTTLGLGDFTPVDNRGRIYVGLEAFIGAFMMALFVYTFARRTGGR